VSSYRFTLVLALRRDARRATPELWTVECNPALGIEHRRSTHYD
jgi:hypothetical protein